MCELLGVSARRPTDVNDSLALLQPRGGRLGPHADGWGLAYYDGRAARIFKEPRPAADSRCLAFITQYDYQSTIVVAHIRKANPSAFGRSVANTHPFERELGGRSWIFAHNGKLPGVKDDPEFRLRRFHPLGETDSEHAFCYLLDQIAADVEMDGAVDPLQLVQRLQEPVDALASLGEFNMLLSDGEVLLAYANKKLHELVRTCVDPTCQCRQEIVLLASAPLTEEPWRPLAQGRLHLYAAGRERTLVA